MKHPGLTPLAAGLIALLLLGPSMAFAKEMVILDSDMVDSFDDGVAMVLLANSPGVELLGVSVLSGNDWVEGSLASALYQLELDGKSGIPVFQGLTYPLPPNRHEFFDIEARLVGRGHDTWTGSFGLPHPSSWEEAYQEKYKRSPILRPERKGAVSFIIDTVRANPNQVTIAAIGPCGDLALAVREAPDIIPLIKRVVYMGGSFHKPGNTTPAAEFNWFFDPPAAKIAVRSPFKEQIVVGLDVCEDVIFHRSDYDRLLQSMGEGGHAKLLRESFLGRNFEKDPNFTFYLWDVLVAAIIIDPTLITQEELAFIDVDDQVGLSYGQSLAYPDVGPLGAQKARIVLGIDQARFWDMLNEKKIWEASQNLQ
jgi:inosine-uridine nucleoside N-ribohydrolase